MNTTSSSSSPASAATPTSGTPASATPLGERALVLGGGGSAGNAWLIGVIAGLADGGVDAARSDLIVGTSAGATAAAQLTSPGATPGRLLDDTLTATPPQRTTPSGAGATARPAGRPLPQSVPDHMQRMRDIIAASTDRADLRRRLGVSALELDAASGGLWSARWRSIVGARFPSASWPEQKLFITAVDARTGDPVVFDRDSKASRGVDLVDAVAASTSSGAAYAVGDDRYIDGGFRRNENADLAAGYQRVLVLSPLGGRTLTPLEWGMQLDAQVEELRAGGSIVETILPDADSLAAFGDNMMDPSTRPPAAHAGFAQGRALAEQLREFWR